MFEKIRLHLNKTMPSYLNWPLFMIIFILIIFLYFNLLKLSEFKGKQYLFKPNEPKYTLTKVWCKLIGGYFMDNTKKYYGINSDYDFACTPHYSDAGKPCKNSTECQGHCIINRLEKDYETNKRAILSNCEQLETTSIYYEKTKFKESDTENYACSKNEFKASCSAFKWDNINDAELNDNIISYYSPIFLQDL